MRTSHFPRRRTGRLAPRLYAAYEFLQSVIAGLQQGASIDTGIPNSTRR